MGSQRCIEGCVQGAVRLQPHNAGVKAAAAERAVEVAANDDGKKGRDGAGLQGDGIRGFRGTCGSEELHHGIEMGEAGVQGAVLIKPDQGLVRSAVPGGEPAAHEDLAIRLNGDGIDDIAGRTVWVSRPNAWVKTGIQAAIGLQPGEVVARHAAHGGEGSGNEDFAIWLAGHDVHWQRISARTLIKAGVQRASGQQPADSVGGDWGCAVVKIAADDKAAVRLKGESVDAVG